MDEEGVARIIEAAYLEFEPALRRRLTARARPGHGKLGVENRVQAAAIGQRLGLVAEDGLAAPVVSAEDR